VTNLVRVFDQARPTGCGAKEASQQAVVDVEATLALVAQRGLPADLGVLVYGRVMALRLWGRWAMAVA